MAITQKSNWDDVGTEAGAGLAKYVVAEQPIAEWDNYFNNAVADDIAAIITAFESHDHYLEALKPLSALFGSGQDVLLTATAIELQIRNAADSAYQSLRASKLYAEDYLYVDEIREKTGSANITFAHKAIFNAHLNVSSIFEKSAGAGVTVDYCLIKDGKAANSDKVGGKQLADLLEVAAGDFDAFAEKVSPANADIVLIEDSAASYAKKKVQVSNLPGGGGSSTWLGLTDTPGAFDNEKIVKSGAAALSFGMLESDIFKKDGSVAMTGDLDMGSNLIKAFGIYRNVENDSLYIDGGINYGARVVLYGKNQVSSPGRLAFAVPNAAKTAYLIPLDIDGATDTPIPKFTYGLKFNTALIKDQGSAELAIRNIADTDWGSLEVNYLTVRENIFTDALVEATSGLGITVDGCLIKDGKVADSNKLEGSTKTQVQTHAPASHGADKHTNVTRSLWIPVMSGQSSGTFNNGELEMPDATATEIEFRFMLPPDFNSAGFSDIKVVGVVGATGNIVFDVCVCGGVHDESYYAINVSSNGQIITGVSANEDVLIRSIKGTMTLTGFTKGHLVYLSVKRDGAHGSDNMAAVFFMSGVLLEYTAEQ